jgi:hypothetical protein
LIALFKGVRYSEGAEHPTVPHTSVLYSIEKRYRTAMLVMNYGKTRWGVEN